jgi:hypothetical protein
MLTEAETIADTKQHSLRAYLLRLFIFFCLSSVLFMPVVWTYNALPCNYNGYIPGYFLAYCSAAVFGDYEHGAYLLELEPEAVASLRQADVLILGNSRTQFGFSTQPVRDYFAERNTKHYVFGFGYVERSAFPLSVLSKVGTRAKLLLVNADPFFSQNLSVPAAEVTSRSFRNLVMWRVKRAFQSIHAPLCRRFPQICRPWAQQPSIFRSASTGEWSLGTFAPSEITGDNPVTGAKRLTLTPAQFDQAVLAANEFIDRLKVRRDCVVLTAIPASINNAEDVARRLSETLNLPILLPTVDGLATIDGSHVDAPSAYRWSSAFMLALDPIFTRCMR